MSYVWGERNTYKMNDPLNETRKLPNGEEHTICKDCLECITCGTCKCGKSTFQFEHLEHAIQHMTVNSKLYKAIKKEVKTRGNWKDAPRGWFAAGKKNPTNFKKEE